MFGIFSYHLLDTLRGTLIPIAKYYARGERGARSVGTLHMAHLRLFIASYSPY